jgi:hypothetical protein
MNIKGYCASAIALAISPVAIVCQAAQINTSPNQIGSGYIPSGYQIVNFSLANGNWKDKLYLPTTPNNGDVVNISSHAQYNTSVDTRNVYGLQNWLTIKNGQSYTFTYRKSQKKWEVSGSLVAVLSPNTTGAIIPDNPKSFTFYNLEDKNWVEDITLPAIAKNGDIINIKNNTVTDSSINAANLVYASTANLKKGDSYQLVYKSNLKGWLFNSVPERQLRGKYGLSVIPNPTSPRTKMSFANGQWYSKIALPTAARDRDRVILTSNAEWSSEIQKNNLNFPSPLTLHRGDTYEFAWIEENKKWEILSTPKMNIAGKNIPNGKLSNTGYPVTNVTIDNDNYLSTLTLPTGMREGYRIIVTSTSNLPSNIIANATTHTIQNNEIISFIVAANGKWERQTYTIDMLMVYSDKAAKALGDQGIKARLFESYTMTNEALENSDANFRLRLVGMKQITAKDSWKALGDPLGQLRGDSQVQAWRTELKADAVYYSGTESGCGLAWVNYNPSKYNMIGSENVLSCGNTVMRHEFGHNMGLSHGGTTTSYAQGNTIIASIMAGNAIPYYSTPKKFTPDYLIPTGIADKYDAVRRINENSKAVSLFN